MIQNFTREGKIRASLSGDNVLTFGTAMNSCTKDQDRIDYKKINIGQSTTYFFGIFDGHGLSSAASDSAESNLLNLLEEELTQLYIAKNSEAQWSDEQMKVACERAFMRTHETIHNTFGRDQRAGSTATVIALQRLPSEWKVQCSWVGDSRAATITLSGSADNLNEDHRLDLPRELERVMEIHKSEESSAPQGERLTVVANRVCNTTGQVGPRVVFNEKTGVSLMVTRALGDPLGASAVICRPDFASRVVPIYSR